MNKDFTEQECIEWLKDPRHKCVYDNIETIIDDCYDEYFYYIMMSGWRALYNIVDKNDLNGAIKASRINYKTFEDSLLDIYEFLFNEFCVNLECNPLYKWVNTKALSYTNIAKLKRTMANYRIIKNNPSYKSDVAMLNKIIDIQKYQFFILDETKIAFQKLVYSKYDIAPENISCNYVPVNILIKEKCHECTKKQCIHSPQHQYFFTDIEDIFSVLKFFRKDVHVHKDCPYILESLVLSQEGIVDSLEAKKGI